MSDVVVAVVQGTVEASILQGLLSTDGIPSYTSPASEVSGVGATLGGGAAWGGRAILVSELDAERAKALIDSAPPAIPGT